MSLIYYGTYASVGSMIIQMPTCTNFHRILCSPVERRLRETMSTRVSFSLVVEGAGAGGGTPAVPEDTGQWGQFGAQRTL